MNNHYNDNLLVINLFNKIRKGSLIYYDLGFYMICLNKKLEKRSGNRIAIRIKGYFFNKRQNFLTQIGFNHNDAKRTKIIKF